MAKDPVCGMDVEEKPDSIRYVKDGREYFFCSTQCLNEFTQPEKELKRLKKYSATVTILPSFFPFQSVYFETSAIIITLILIGRLLESRTKEKASSAVRKLLDLQPRMAKVIREEVGGATNEVEVPIEQIQQGELLVIRPGERVPTDGIVIQGSSSIDESAITGESIPVDKSPGSEVIGATINKSRMLQVKATKVGQDTVLSQIITLVEEARAGKAAMQKMADKIAKYFVPAVILIATTAALGWYFAGNIGFTYSLLAFVSVIIIACPCALGIATPAALMMGTGKGAQNGILFKGGEYLEIANKVKTIVFDKTGTLTQGRPSVTDIITLSDFEAGKCDDSDDGIGKTELLRLVAIAESGSEHPLGQAVVRKAREEEYGMLVPNPDSFEALSGHGVRATYSGHTILVGNRKLMDDNKIPVTEKVDSILEELEKEGKTATLVSIDNKLSGIIALADTIKDEAKEGIESLKSMGMEVIMLTGDNERTAHTISSKLGIKRVIAQVLPQQKEEVISNLKTERQGEEKKKK